MGRLKPETKERIRNYVKYHLNEKHAHNYETGTTLEDIIHNFKKTPKETLREINANHIQYKTLYPSRLATLLKHMPEIKSEIRYVSRKRGVSKNNITKYYLTNPP